MSVDKIQITDEAIASIIQNAVKRVQGVNSLVGGLVDGINGMLGSSSLSKGISLDISSEEKKVKVCIAIEHGYNISSIGKEIQENIRKDMKEMVNISLDEINVHVDKVCGGWEMSENKKYALIGFIAGFIMLGYGLFTFVFAIFTAYLSVRYKSKIKSFLDDYFGD